MENIKPIVKFLVNNLGKIFITLSLMLWVYSAYHTMSYDQDNYDEVTIIDKLEGISGGKYPSTEFILVGRLKDGTARSLTVTPSWYATAKVGEKTLFISYQNPTFMHVMIVAYFILYIFMAIIGGGAVLCTNIGKIREKWNDVKIWANS